MLTQSFADALLEAETIITSAPHIKTEQDLAEGYDYLAGHVRGAIQLAWAYQRDFPYFVASTGPYTKMGLDNPDTLYFHSYLRDDAEYVVTGRRGSTADLSFQVLNGDYSPAEVPDSLTAFDDREIEVAPDGSFELRFGPARRNPGPQYITLPAGSAMLLVREVYSDWALERRGSIQIHRADRAGAAPPAADTGTMAKRYRVAGKILLSRLRTFLAFPEWFYLNLPVNTLTEPRPTPGGLATQFSAVGHYDLADDQAMIVTVPAAGHRVAPYQGIQLGSMWYISLDYINHQTSLTADQARVDPDGMLRFVISEQDPGVLNWLERTGHSRGYVQLRWQRLTRELTAEDGPSAEVLPVSELPGPAAVLPGGPLPGSGVRGPDRRPAGRGGRENAGLMLLAGQVVVVCGIGPGLGRSIAVRCARAGADVVLAARTESRLEEVAKEVAALGRRALAVPTDITDEAAGGRAGRGGPGGVRPGGHAGAQRVLDPAAGRPGRRGPGRDPGCGGYQRDRRAADDQAVHPGAGRQPGLGRDDQLGRAAALPAALRRLQDSQVRAAGAGPEPGHRAGPAAVSGSTRSRLAGSGPTCSSGTSATWPSSAG